jgi:hypothetical protein
LTNSSSIFQGVEVSLYLLLDAFLKESAAHPFTLKLVTHCAEHLKDGTDSFKEIHRLAHAYFNDPEIQAHCVFSAWPQHTSAKQLETMLTFSDRMISLHKDEKHLITGILSEAVFEACGRLMLHDSWLAPQPVAWIGHDVVARTLTAPSP